jgi:hypothetical protein
LRIKFFEMMRNILMVTLFIFALAFVQLVKGQTADDIINRYINTRGGLDKLTAIKSIYMEGIRQMMGNEVQLKVTKVQGKLNRVDFQFGDNSGYTIITPDKGWTYFPMRSDKAEEIPSERLMTMHEQLDIPGPLVEYQEKGYKAALLGKDTVNNEDAWKIQLSDSTGKVTTFYIDSATNLLVRSSQMIPANSNRNTNEPNEIITDYSDYKDFDGVLFPQTVTTEGSGMGGGSMFFDTIKLNQPVDDKLYKPSN